MRHLKNITGLAFAMFLFASCSHLQSSNSSDGGGGHEIDLTIASDDMYAAPGTSEGFSTMLRSSSKGSVQIYPIDSPVETLRASEAHQQGFVTSPETSRISPLSFGAHPALDGDSVLTPPRGGFAKDPRVEVFPFDESSRELPSFPALKKYSAPENIEEPSLLKSLGTLKAPLSEGRPEILASVYFEHDSTSLEGVKRQKILNFVRDYLSSSDAMVHVEGHASVRSSIPNDIEKKVINLKVSMNRALSVSQALIEAGLPEERIETTAFGASRPASGVSLDEQEAASRRVDILGL